MCPRLDIGIRASYFHLGLDPLRLNHLINFFYGYRSCVLMLQISLPCLVFGSAETKVKFGGGTNAIMAPQIDYFTEVSDLRSTMNIHAKGGSAFLYTILTLVLDIRSYCTEIWH
jgi:hypothetical protein